MRKIFSVNDDVLGLLSTVICLLHCLVLPFIVILPLTFTDNHYIDLVFVLVGAYAVVNILKSQTNKYIKMLLIISMTLLILSIVYVLLTDIHTIFQYVASIGVIVGHISNFYYQNIYIKNISIINQECDL